MTIQRWVVVGLGVLAALAGGYWASGAPRMTLLNTGIRIEYPGWQPAAALGAALGLALVAAASSRRWLHIALGIAAAVLALYAAGRLRYRLDASSDRLVSQGLLGETAIPWRAVARVDKGPDVILVWGQGDAQLRIATSDFTQEQRAALERAVARRVQEAQSARPPASPQQKKGS